MKLPFPLCTAVPCILWIAVACGANTNATTAKSTADDPAAEPSIEIEALTKKVEALDTRLQKIETLLAQYLEESNEPDPTAVYAIPIDGLPSVGTADAKVTVVKAYEYACGYCARSVATINQLLSEYAGNIRVVYAPYIVHADVAIIPALAACAADHQSKFSEMSALIWEKGFAEHDLSSEKMTALAQQLNLDMQRFQADTTSTECMEQVQSSAQTLAEFGTTGTPTFYINGRYLPGAQPIEAFRVLINEELDKADKAIAGGVPASQYYRKVVIEGGKKSL